MYGMLNVEEALLTSEAAHSAVTAVGPSVVELEPGFVDVAAWALTPVDTTTW